MLHESCHGADAESLAILARFGGLALCWAELT